MNHQFSSNIHVSIMQNIINESDKSAMTNGNIRKSNIWIINIAIEENRKRFISCYIDIKELFSVTFKIKNKGIIKNLK